jgi:Putative zinc-finger
MTTGAMNCERFTDQLMDYLEHDVDAATRASVEHHAVTCVDCGALLADIRKLRVDAANLPELAPSRDLWSGIAARIETPVVPIGAGATSSAGEGNVHRAPRRVVRRVVNAALVAASLVAAAMLGYGARDTEREVVQTVAPTVPMEPSVVAPDGPLPTQVAELPDAAATPARSVPDRVTPTPAAATPGAARAVEVQLAVAKLSADYDREIARLRVLIDQRRSQLDPTTVSVIERNLAVIDTAIAESRRAIVNDPSSRFLIEFLNQSLRDKVELMRTAALLPSRT